MKIVKNLCLTCKHYIKGEHECDEDNYIETIDFYEEVVAECSDYEEAENDRL